jgi:phospholipid transport system substrate-binding protein
MKQFIQSMGAAGLALVMLAGTAQAVDDNNPRALIETAAQEMLKDLEANRAAYRKDPTKIHAMVERVLLPHFDTDYAAQRVLGRHWTAATPDQRKRFTKAFYQSLLENYGTALLDFTADKLEVLPFRGNPKAERATVQTRVKRSDGTRVDVNYTLRKTPAGWKAWDVTIEGISYVKNFRDDFGPAIDQKGLEALIVQMETKGVKAKAPPKAKS